MSLINERHIDTDRAGDSKGAGNYPTLMDFLNKKKVINSPFSEVDIVVSASQFVLLNDTIINGALSIGGALSNETNGGYVAALLPSSIGSGDVSNIVDSIGNVVNVVDIRNSLTHDPLLDANNRRIYGLLQADSTAVDGDIIGAVGSENCQLSFVIIDDSGNFALTAINETIEVSIPKLYADRHLPSFRKEGTNADADIIGSVSAPLIRKFVVTSPFAINELITLSTGTGNVSGVATISGDSVSIGASVSEFNNTNTIRIRVNGTQLFKGDEVNWGSSDSLSFTIALDIGDTFQVEVV